MADYALSHAFLVEAALEPKPGNDDVVLHVQYGELQEDPTNPELGQELRALNIDVRDEEAELVAGLLSEGVVRRGGMIALGRILRQPVYDVGDMLMGKICEIFDADKAANRPRNMKLEELMDALVFEPWAYATIVGRDGYEAEISADGQLVPFVEEISSFDDEIPSIAAENDCTHGVFTFELGDDGIVKNGSRGHITIGTVNARGRFEGYLTILDQHNN